jgi:hypothetical protein
MPIAVSPATSAGTPGRPRNPAHCRRRCPARNPLACDNLVGPLLQGQSVDVQRRSIQRIAQRILDGRPFQGRWRRIPSRPIRHPSGLDRSFGRLAQTQEKSCLHPPGARVRTGSHRPLRGPTLRGRRTRRAGRGSGRRRPAGSRGSPVGWRRGRTPWSGAPRAGRRTRRTVRSVTTIRGIAPVQGMPPRPAHYVRSSPLRSGGRAHSPAARPRNLPPAHDPAG